MWLFQTVISLQLLADEKQENKVNKASEREKIFNNFFIFCMINYKILYTKRLWIIMKLKIESRIFCKKLDIFKIYDYFFVDIRLNIIKHYFVYMFF